MNFEEKTKNQGTSQPEASQEVNGDMAKEWEELVELDDVQLATVVGGGGVQSGSVPLPIGLVQDIRAGRVFVYQDIKSGVIWFTTRQPKPGQPGGNVGNGARLLNQYYY